MVGGIYRPLGSWCCACGAMDVLGIASLDDRGRLHTRIWCDAEPPRLAQFPLPSANPRYASEVGPPRPPCREVPGKAELRNFTVMLLVGSVFTAIAAAAWCCWLAR